jgi:hypothetical protein
MEWPLDKRMCCTKTKFESKLSFKQEKPNSLSQWGRSSMETPNAEPLRSGGYRLLGGLALAEPEHDGGKQSTGRAE